MIDQKLVQYFDENLKKGYDLNAIKTTLINYGYNKDNVNDAVNYFQMQGLKNTFQNLQYAGFWWRFSAIIWDTLIIGIPIAIFAYLIVWATGIKSIEYLIDLLGAAFVIYMEGMKGGTPGKLILGLQIQNEKGGLIGIPNAILRYIGKILSGLIFCIGFFMIGWDQKKQGLHDKIAKTFVIKKLGDERKALFIVGIIIGVLIAIIIPIIIFGFLVAIFAGRMALFQPSGLPPGLK